MGFDECSYEMEYNFDSGDENDGVPITNGSKEFHYDVWTIEEVSEYRMGIINEVSSLLELSSTIARIFLSHFKWDKDKLLEKYFDSNTEKFFKDAHVMNPSKQLPIADCHKMSQNCTEVCIICLSVLPPDGMTSLECGHRFCLNCWREYLTTKIICGGVIQSISCPAHACDILADDVTVIKLVPELKMKYQQLMINNFVECNKHLRWCPYVDCRYVIRVSDRGPRPVRCRCGFLFCFACGEGWHDPIKCCWLQKWIKKCDEDSATSNWIAAHTKECPRCNVIIEKDGGCNHMVCKNPHCQYDFCWVCLGPWEPHGTSWYSCNRFDDPEAKAARDVHEKQRASLAKYLHYCNRYVNHKHSLKFEKNLYASTKERMEELQQHNMTWIDVQFLNNAVDVLCQCRQTLMYTYAFAYYLEKNNQLVLFEDNQKDLETATEVLSEYLERDITSEYLEYVSQHVQNKFRYCEKRRNALLAHVHEGYKKKWWSYVE